MAITQATVTVSSTRATIINYQAGDTLSAIASTVVAFITTRGWEQIHTNGTVWAFRSLSTDGTSGTATHYEYMSLEFQSTYVLMKSWLSWSGSSGSVSNIYNIYTSGSSVGLSATDANIGQPIDTTVGGNLLLIADRCVIHIKGTTTGRLGNVANNAGTLITERLRVHTSDTVGASPVSIYAHAGNICSAYVSAGVQTFRWSATKGINGATAANSLSSVSCGYYGGFSAGSEYVYAGGNVPRTTPADLQIITANDDYDSSAESYAVRVGYLNSAVTAICRLGTLRNICRKYGEAVGNIIVQNADSNGVPSADGVSSEYLVIASGLGMLV